MRVLVIDRHPLFAEAIGNRIRALRGDVEIVEVHTAADARSHAGSGGFDLVVYDWDLPDFTGLAALKSICRGNAHVPVLAVSATVDAESATQAIRSGAAGVIPRFSPREAVQDALRLVMSGGIYFPAEVAMSALVPAGRPQTRQDFALKDRQRFAVEGKGLSNREIDVLELLVAGHSNKIIGQRLNIAVCTVKAHITSILRALNAASRTQAIYQVTHGDMAS